MVSAREFTVDRVESPDMGFASFWENALKFGYTLTPIIVRGTFQVWECRNDHQPDVTFTFAVDVAHGHKVLVKGIRRDNYQNGSLLEQSFSLRGNDEIVQYFMPVKGPLNIRYMIIRSIPFSEVPGRVSMEAFTSYGNSSGAAFEAFYSEKPEGGLEAHFVSIDPFTPEEAILYPKSNDVRKPLVTYGGQDFSLPHSPDSSPGTTYKIQKRGRLFVASKRTELGDGNGIEFHANILTGLNPEKVSVLEKLARSSDASWLKLLAFPDEKQPLYSPPQLTMLKVAVA